jgi:hypothetical protein
MVQENKRDAFSLSWWPIDLAIAWVFTRDRTFVERQWRRQGDGLIGIEIAVAVDQNMGTNCRLHFKDLNTAWTELKARLEEGRIEVVGTSFRREADSSAKAVETAGDQQKIADTEVGSLMLHEDGNDLCLIPEDWRVARGSNWNNLKGYRNVHVRTNGVIHFFPLKANVELPSELMGPPRNPLEPGWMPLSDAAYWIASQGGQSSFDLRDVERWKVAFDALLPRLSSGVIAAIGRRHRRGLAAPIDPVSFSGLAVDYPYSESPFELICCERPHLQCYGIGDSDQWEKEFNDSIMGDDLRIPEYSHLQIKNADLAREFSFGAVRDSPRGLRAEIRQVCKRLWPDGKMPARIKERNKAIQSEFAVPPNERTIRRALAN